LEAKLLCEDSIIPNALKRIKCT